MIKNYLVFILLISSFMFGEEKDDELTYSEYLKSSWEYTGNGFVEKNKNEDDRNVEIISTTLYPDGVIKEMFVHDVFHDTIDVKLPRKWSVRNNYLEEYYLYNTDGDLIKYKNMKVFTLRWTFHWYYVSPQSSKKLTGSYYENRKHGHWTGGQRMER